MLQRVSSGLLYALLLAACVAGIFLAFAYLFHVPGGGHGPSPLLIVPVLLFFYVLLFVPVALFVKTGKGRTRALLFFALLHVGASLVLHPSVPVPIVQVLDTFKHFANYESIAYAQVYASSREPVLKATALAKYEPQIPTRGVQIFYYSRNERPYSYYLEVRPQPPDPKGVKTYHDPQAQVHIATNNPNIEFEARPDGLYVKDQYQQTDIAFSLPGYLRGGQSLGTSLGSFKEIRATLRTEAFAVRSRYARWAGQLIHFLRD